MKFIQIVNSLLPKVTPSKHIDYEQNVLFNTYKECISVEILSKYPELLNALDIINTTESEKWTCVVARDKENRDYPLFLAVRDSMEIDKMAMIASDGYGGACTYRWVKPGSFERYDDSYQIFLLQYGIEKRKGFAMPLSDFEDTKNKLMALCTGNYKSMITIISAKFFIIFALCGIIALGLFVASCLIN